MTLWRAEDYLWVFSLTTPGRNPVRIASVGQQTASEPRAVLAAVPRSRTGHDERGPHGGRKVLWCEDPTAASRYAPCCRTCLLGVRLPGGACRMGRRGRLSTGCRPAWHEATAPDQSVW